MEVVEVGIIPVSPGMAGLGRVAVLSEMLPVE
jgi:hypothetical protein